MSILVVDDEKDMALLFQQKFRKEIRAGEITFKFAYSGEEAIEYIIANHPEIVLILSDINMPGMSGIELLKNIKNKVKELPVIMVSAYGDEKNYREAMEYGAEDFVTKPIDFSDLKDKIDKYKQK